MKKTHNFVKIVTVRSTFLIPISKIMGIELNKKDAIYFNLGTQDNYSFAFSDSNTYYLDGEVPVTMSTENADDIIADLESRLG